MSTFVVYLWSCGEVYGPELSVGGHLGRTHQLVPGGPQEVAPSHVPQCPAAVFVVGHRHLEHARHVTLLALARHIAVLLGGAREESVGVCGMLEEDAEYGRTREREIEVIR